ncbi:OmpA family protein [Dokdonella sp. MW10]|uniref:OmpA family protein n=1 Tax=Dokdonella sp. MW10 TaxID=2992926 RepID=UPI003F7CDDCF
MNTVIRRATPLLAVALLAACASTPKGPPPEIVRLQDEVTRLRSDPAIAPNAVEEIGRADAAVSLLAAEHRQLKEPMFRHGIYIADRLVQTAEANGLARYAETRGKELGIERDRLLVDVRAREAADARLAANSALATAESERRAAELARADALAARSELETMRSKLTELETKQTERGLVVTLGDVLFEVNRSELKPGAARSLDQLAAALREDPQASVSIEGHTDSTGNHAYNIDLSARRANTVRNYLVSQGIPDARLRTRGLGPDYPVASNGNEAGRQQNRRVEVIVSSGLAQR